MSDVEVRSAEFSDDRKYRYTLRIAWGRPDDGKPMVQFIGLNPSTADETQDDPTIRRCKRFAKDNGFGGMVMTNLFAWRSTDPAGLKTTPLPQGEAGCFIAHNNFQFTCRNDFFLYTTALRCPMRIACWGTHGGYLFRAAKFKQMFRALGIELHALGFTSNGSPRHPLYLKADCKPIEFKI